MRRRLSIFAIALAAACSGQDNTRIMVAVWSDLDVPTELDGISINVFGTNKNNWVDFSLTSGGDSGQTQLPVQLELLPHGDKNKTVNVKVVGLLGKKEIVSQSARTKFIAGQSLLLWMSLTRNCKEKEACPAEYTCKAGSCDQPIEVTDLPPYVPDQTLTPPDAGIIDGSTSIDIGTSEAGPIDRYIVVDTKLLDTGIDRIADIPVVDVGSAYDAMDVPLGGAGGSAGIDAGSGGKSGTGGHGTGGATGTGGTTTTCVNACTANTTQCASGTSLQTCKAGTNSCTAWSTSACSTDLVCERYGTAACADPNWNQWPLPNSQVDVTEGAPNLANYVDNGDGTVTDSVTKLMWQQAVPTATYAWKDAAAYCNDLALAKYSDWRLPTSIELSSIVDYGTKNPSINGTYFPSTPADDFWSSSALANSSSNAWYFDFDDGDMNKGDLFDAINVRCVR